jgi:hypothetical protein
MKIIGMMTHNEAKTRIRQGLMRVPAYVLPTNTLALRNDTPTVATSHILQT